MKSRDITLEDFIDSLLKYNIKHFDEFPHNRVDKKHELHGLIDYDDNTILLNDKLDLEERRKTIIHEFYHSIGYHNEDQVERLTNRMYKKLYGPRK